MQYIKGKKTDLTFQIRKKTNTFSIFIIRLSKRIDDFNSTFNCLASLKISKTTTKFDVPKTNDLSWAKFELQLRNIIQMMSVAFLEISPYNKLKMYMCKKPKKKCRFRDAGKFFFKLSSVILSNFFSIFFCCFHITADAIPSL